MKKQSGKKEKSKTPTKQKTLPNKTPKSEKKKTWNGCGAENRGLKGGGLWFPLGGAPHPWQNTGSGPPTQPPKSLGGHRGDIFGERIFEANQPGPTGTLVCKAPLSPLLRDTLPVI